jgi:hypothetical protein
MVRCRRPPFVRRGGRGQAGPREGMPVDGVRDLRASAGGDGNRRRGGGIPMMDRLPGFLRIAGRSPLVPASMGGRGRHNAAIGTQDSRRGRAPSGSRPVHHSRTSPASPSGASGKSRASTAAASGAGGLQSMPRPRAMSYPCTSTSLQPRARNPPGSVGPQCQDRELPGVAVAVVDSSRAVDSITTSSPDGRTSARTAKSTGRYPSCRAAAICSGHKRSSRGRRAPPSPSSSTPDPPPPNSTRQHSLAARGPR